MQSVGARNVIFFVSNGTLIGFDSMDVGERRGQQHGDVPKGGNDCYVNGNGSAVCWFDDKLYGSW